MKPKLFIVIIIILTAGLVLLGNYISAQEWKPEIKFFKIGTGPAGGVWYPMGAVVSEKMNKELTPLRASVLPGGAISNLMKLNRNELQIVFSQLSSEWEAWEGKGEFKEQLRNIRHLNTFIPSDFCIFVRAESGINKIEDLKDKKIVVGQKGFMSEWLARMVLEAYGITYKQIVENGGLISYLTYREGASLLQDKHTDAVAIMASHPFALLMELSTQTKIKILNIEKRIINKIVSENKGLIEVTDPYEPGTYGMDKVQPTIGAPYAFAIHKDISEELAYRILEIIYANMGEIAAVGGKNLLKVTVKDLDLGACIPLHPGAERYLKEHRK